MTVYQLIHVDTYCCQCVSNVKAISTVNVNAKSKKKFMYIHDLVMSP